MKQYPTAYCKVCGKPIYNSEGQVDRKGYWICKECLEKHLSKTHKKAQAYCSICGYTDDPSEIKALCPKCQLVKLELIYEGFPYVEKPKAKITVVP